MSHPHPSRSGTHANARTHALHARCDSGSAKCVLLVIAMSIEADGVCWLTRAEIAQMACVSSGTTHYSLKQLADSGYISQVRRGVAVGWKLTTSTVEVQASTVEVQASTVEVQASTVEVRPVLINNNNKEEEEEEELSRPAILMWLKLGNAPITYARERDLEAAYAMLGALEYGRLLEWAKEKGITSTRTILRTSKSWEPMTPPPATTIPPPPRHATTKTPSTTTNGVARPPSGGTRQPAGNHAGAPAPDPAAEERARQAAEQHQRDIAIVLARRAKAAGAGGANPAPHPAG